MLSQNGNGLQSKISLCKRKQTRVVALGALLRSFDVDIFALQEPHFSTAEDRQAAARCLSRYGYGLDGPLHEDGRGGVVLAWKTKQWTLNKMQHISPRALKASLSSGPLEITVVVVHFHHKHTRRLTQWRQISPELQGPNILPCANHNSLIMKNRDAFTPPESEHDTSLRAREQEVAALARAGLHDVWVDMHCPTLMDIIDKDSSNPIGFTYGYPREGTSLDPQRLRRIHRIHAVPDLWNLVTSTYPMFVAKSDHKAVLVEFTPPTFEAGGTAARFYFPQTIVQDTEAMEELESSLHSIATEGDQWWEDALQQIRSAAVTYHREHNNKKQSVEQQALRLLRDSSKEMVSPAVYQFVKYVGIEATDPASTYTLLVGVYEKSQKDKIGMETLSKPRGVIASGETSGDSRSRRNELYRLMRELQERRKLQQLMSHSGTPVRGAVAAARTVVEHWDRVSAPTGATEEECTAYLKQPGIGSRLWNTGRPLFSQLSLDIVKEGLKLLNINGALGLDGFSAKFLKRPPGLFEEQMLTSMRRFLETGTMPESWTSGPVTMIPKKKGDADTIFTATNSLTNHAAKMAHQHHSDSNRGRPATLRPSTANGISQKQKHTPACLWVPGSMGWPADGSGFVG